MNKRNIRINMLAAFLSILLLIGCSVPKKITQKEIQPPPASYPATVIADTSSIARLGYQEYFSDTLLTGLIAEVLNNNFDHRMGAERLKIAESLLLVRKGALLPSVNLVAEATGTRYGRHTIEGVGNFDTNLSPNIDKSQQVNTRVTPNYWLGLDASWEIDLWGKLKQMKKAARERFLATVHGRDLLRSAIVTETAFLYYELIALDREADILQENISLQKEALEMVKVQKEVGRATELAVQQFEAQLANTEVVLIDVRQQISATENQVLFLCGKYEGTIKRNNAIDVNGIRYLARHGQPGQLMQYRPDIQTMFRELKATRADAHAARAAFFPTITLSAYGGYNSFNTGYLFNPTSMVFQMLGNITAPIFQRHQIRANFKIATASQEIAFLEYQKSVVNAYQEVKTVLSYLNNTEKMLGVKSQEVNALTRGVEVSNDLYVAGYANYLEIISSQKSKLTADMDLIKLQRNQAQGLIQLYKALGGGWQ
ncbi:MAG: efflux transporter outer membrane subunit [Chitinophagaceae bacterium]